jgi:hypothetical protein
MNTRFKNALILIASYAVSTGASTSFAHDGHGLTGSHWHATDSWGFVAMLGVVVVTLWLSGGKK